MRMSPRLDASILPQDGTTSGLWPLNGNDLTHPSSFLYLIHANLLTVTELLL